ncbi:hypothetical protein ACVMII_003886 [Bradyrhizobium diazoefficiens]
MYAAYEKTRTAAGVYRSATVEKVPMRVIKINPNRFGPNPFFSLQSGGMPGNEETDPGS